eukprot:3445857-Pyramimonas_sp.AAC.1
MPCVRLAVARGHVCLCHGAEAGVGWGPGCSCAVFPSTHGASSHDGGARLAGGRGTARVRAWLAKARLLDVPCMT